MAVLRSSFRDTTVNPLFTIILTLCRPHFGLMLQRYTFAKARNHFDFGCAVCGWCPCGTCDAIKPKHVAIRFAGCRYNTCELTSNLYIFHWSLQMLTQRQKDALKRHAAHHTKAHIDYMRRRMHAGDSFSEAHRKAQKQVGK